MKCFLWFFLLIHAAGCHSLHKKTSFEEPLSKIPIEDQQKLETLFHQMMTGDYFACTLFGNKPLTFQEFFEDPWKLPAAGMFYPHGFFYLEQGWNTWIKYQNQFPSSRFIFKKIPSKVGYEFIILINKLAFSKLFDENKDIFEKVLGPQITQQKILQEFEKGEKPLSQILNEHEGLVGLVLGYGREASLSAFRSHILSNQILRKSLHPLIPSSTHDKLLSKGAQTSLILREKRLCQQGVKWHSIEQIDVKDPYEELNQNKQKRDYFYPSWQEQFVHILPPNFSCVKNSNETEQLRNDYNQAMALARKTFKTKSFLRGFLEQYCSE